MSYSLARTTGLAFLSVSTRRCTLLSCSSNVIFIPRWGERVRNVFTIGGLSRGVMLQKSQFLYDVSTSRCYSKKRRDSNAAEQHVFYQQQMLELQEERESLFGETSEAENTLESNTGAESSDQATKQQGSSSGDVLFRDSLEDLKEERQSLFGFTDEEQTAWGSGGGTHKHDAEFLAEIERARAANERGELDADGREIIGTVGRPSEKTDKGTLDSSDNHHSSGLTHVTSDGTSVHMVNVGSKAVTRRTATAQSVIVFPDNVVQTLRANANTMEDDTTLFELVGPKGPIFATAITAGIMAAKQTSNLIPLCHPLPLESVEVDVSWRNENTAVIACTCRVTHKTGVEMEALTGATVAALTVFDMIKALSHDVCITETKLVSKEGGKRSVRSDDFTN